MEDRKLNSSKIGLSPLPLPLSSPQTGKSSRTEQSQPSISSQAYK
jgi:hypothetical protein